MTKATSWVHLQFVSSNLNRYLIEEARCSAITEGLTYLSSIEDEGDYSAQMHQLQTMEFSPSDAYSVLDYLIATGQNADILSKFDLIEQNYDLTEWQAYENSALRDLYVIEAGSNYKYNFSASELNMLENNVDSKFDAVAMKATKLLSMQNPCFTDDPIFGSAATGYRSEQVTTVRSVENQIKVYPNPTVESVIIELPTVGYYNLFTLVDKKGQLMLDGAIPHQSQVFTLSMRHLAAGSYVLTLQGAGTKTVLNTTIVKQ